MIIWE